MKSNRSVEGNHDAAERFESATPAQVCRNAWSLIGEEVGESKFAYSQLN